MIVRELLARLGLKVDGGSFEKGKEAVGGIASAVFKIQAGAMAAKAAMLAVLNSVADQARATENTARITGLSTDQVQQLGYAAKASGVSTEELQHGLVHLARSATEAARGSQEAAAGYFRLGIQTTSADGKVRPLGDLLAEVAGKFASMPDGTEKAAAAMQLFGRAGAELIPLLDKGPAGLSALNDEARRLGIVMGSDTLTGAAKYRVAMRQAMGAIEGLKVAIADQLFPAFAASARQFADWIATHRQWIALKVHQAFNAVTHVMRGLLSVGERAYRLFERIWKSGNAGKATLLGLVAAASAVAAPWLTLVGVLALVADDVEVYLAHNGGRSITGLVVKAFKIMAEKASEAWEDFKAGFSEGWEAFKKDPFGKLYEWADEIAGYLEDVFSVLGEMIAEFLGVDDVIADWKVKWKEFQAWMRGSSGGGSGDSGAGDGQPKASAGKPGTAGQRLFGVATWPADTIESLWSAPGDPKMNGGLKQRLAEFSSIGDMFKSATSTPGSTATGGPPSILQAAAQAMTISQPTLLLGSASASRGGGGAAVPGATFTIGPITVNGAPTDKPADFARNLAEELTPLIDEHWSRKMRETSGAVDR